MRTSRWSVGVLVALLAIVSNAAATAAPPESGAPSANGSPDAQLPPIADKPEATSVQTASPASVLIPDLQDITFGSWADILVPGRWSGGIGLSLSGQREKIATALTSQTFTSRIADETIGIRYEDFGIVDQRLVSGTVGVLFGREQFRQTADDLVSSQRENLLGYNVDLTFLSESPYRSSLYANRSQTTTTLISGGTTKNETENSGFVLRWGENSVLRTREILPYFSASLEGVQEHEQTTTHIGDSIFRLDDQLDTATFNVHNGTETSDLNFRYTFDRVKDNLDNANSYNDQSANMLYSLDFGPTLNRRWDSSIDYYNRNAADYLGSVSSTNVSEALTIDHYDNLSSAYNYQYSRQTSIAGDVTVQSAGLQGVYRLYNNLTTTAGVFGLKQDLPTGSADSRLAQLSFSYDHGVPWGGQMVAGLGGSYSITNSQVPGGSVPVVDAPYTAPPSFGTGIGFQLKDSFIDVSTISVVDLKGDARLPTVVNVDYIVVVTGNRTSIEPLPTSVVIMPNDKLQVSYIYAVPPDLKYRITTNFANLALYWSWIGLELNHNDADSTPLTAGDTALLVTSRDDSARLSLNGAWDTLQARGDANVERFRGNQLNYDTVSFDEFLNWAATPDLFISFSANQFRTNYSLPVRRVNGNSVRLDASTTWEGWLANAYITERWYSDTDIGNEKYQEAGFKLNRRWLKLDIALVLSANRRWQSGTETQNATAQFTATRHF